MPNNNPYNHSNVTGRVSTYAPRASLAGAGIGMVVGSTAALARNIRQVKAGAMTRREAAANTISAGLGAGLATGAATAVVSTVGLSGLAGLLGVFTVATGVQYLWQEAAEPAPAAPTAPSTKKAKSAKRSAEKE